MQKLEEGCPCERPGAKRRTGAEPAQAQGFPKFPSKWTSSLDELVQYAFQSLGDTRQTLQSLDMTFG